MYTKKLSEFLRESEDDYDKEPAKSHRMQASIAKKVIDNRLNMTPWEHIPYVFFFKYLILKTKLSKIEYSHIESYQIIN